MMQRHGGVERVTDYVGEVMVGKAPGLGEPVGMHEHDEPQLLGACEDLAKAIGRKILAGDMGHDLDAAKPQRFVQSVEYGNRETGSLKRHCAEADETVWVTAADLSDEIVDGARSLAPE